MLQLNPVTPDNLRDPIPLYRELRENHPVYWVEEIQAWIITRYEDVKNGFRSPQLSANRSKFFEAQVQMVSSDMGLLIDTVRRQMVHQDGADHLRLRRQLSPAFSPHLLDSWRSAIRNTINKLVEPLQSQGHMDVAQDISYHLPAQVIAEFLNVPLEDRERFQAWTKPIFKLSGPSADMDVVAVVRESHWAVTEFDKYFRALIEERRRSPGSDIITHMLQFSGPGRMSDEEVVANLCLILSAGHSTTTDQISNGMHDLLSHRDQLQQLQDNPSLIESAVDEIMRFHPAVPCIHRFATEDFELRGQHIRKGQLVFLSIGSANRDPEVFPDPDRFDIRRDRSQQKHLSFSFGPHHCLGAGLARRELEITFEVLLTRLQGLRLDETQTPKLKCDNLVFRGFNSLPIRW